MVARFPRRLSISVEGGRVGLPLTEGRRDYKCSVVPGASSRRRRFSLMLEVL